ncbi:MAG TPA: glycosyltransferase [Jiangellales bacterium]|nr:glycosyltransferase [Jiangellales bacterium]
MLPADRAEAPVGYVVKRYPRFSETFVVREVLARERAGERIEIASLRPSVDTRFHELLAQVRAPVTRLPDDLRSAERAWATVRAARAVLPGLDPVLPELVEVPAVEAVQAVLLARWVVERGIGHLHAHFATGPGRTARLASLITGVPYSLTAHAKDLFHDSVDRAVLGRVLGDAHHVVTVSDWNVAWVQRTLPAVAGRVHRVYNGLDLGSLRWSCPADRPPLIAAVGRMVEKKGFADLLDAVALLRDRGAPTRLELAGEGPTEPALHEQVRRSDLGELVTFRGPLPQHEVLELLRRAAAFAAPCVVADDGDRDGLPTVLLEAMAVGTPCVATPVTGIPEVVRHDETGLLVPERDPYALADALGHLVTDGARRDRLSRGARALLEESFDSADQARALHGLRDGARSASRGAA